MSQNIDLVIAGMIMGIFAVSTINSHLQNELVLVTLIVLGVVGLSLQVSRLVANK